MIESTSLEIFIQRKFSDLTHHIIKYVEEQVILSVSPWHGRFGKVLHLNFCSLQPIAHSIQTIEILLELECFLTSWPYKVSRTVNGAQDAAQYEIIPRFIWPNCCPNPWKIENTWKINLYMYLNSMNTHFNAIRKCP